jgi:hypothetical protein
MVLITPRLVRALDPDEVPLLPTRPGDFIDPLGEEGKKPPPPEMIDGPEGGMPQPPPPTPGTVKRPPPGR